MKNWSDNISVIFSINKFDDDTIYLLINFLELNIYQNYDN